MTDNSDPPGAPDSPDRDPKKNRNNYFLRVFYHHPEDPDLMVPMRYGSGVDFNYARWPGRAAAILVAAGLAYVLLTALT
ncbi:DUF5808 domain-containing protein [Corynebacterium halotolerans]|uniref:DUF5808 domain-containing protein n=1 Tax=Corynebacterium halotolerans YIM 70093 = DSM 44683 TaxID=1121362 RepID=M1P164_9CORY|nr:DUF5808 domain-containing protein [Corynebacterium halotolerans]AGF73520.1 hypothetical protein A605_12620 [Corynebacterium halotolerans YIM 70093 = DSM 44683]